MIVWIKVGKYKFILMIFLETKLTDFRIRMKLV